MSQGRHHNTPTSTNRVTERPGEPQPDVADDADEAPTAPHLEVTEAFLSKIPVVILSREDLNAADLDNRDYFLISLMDAMTTIENLLDISGMPSEEALALLAGLERRGIISLAG
jgi:hypothetical protein